MPLYKFFIKINTLILYLCIVNQIVKMKENLKNYLEQKGKTHTWAEIYEMFPYKGLNITRKQMADGVRAVWRKIKRKEKKEKSVNKFPKILIFDIETAPLKAYVWRLWKQNINPLNGQLQSEWFMLTYSAKWLFDKNIISEKLNPQEALKEDDSRLVKSLWKLFDEADIIIAHNAKNFDVKIMNTRFLKTQLPSPSHYQIIDTLHHAKKQFSFESNKLDYIAKFLGLGSKIKTNFELWEGCVNGDQDALDAMSKYNDQDVFLLEDVYLKLRPFIKPHPNVTLFFDNEIERCPTCASDKLETVGTYNTQVSSFNSVRCKCCGSVSRTRKNNISSETRKNLLISNAR